MTVPEGTLIIEAAAKAGILIPRFCYHRLLKPYGGCRMCLVDITAGSSRDPRPIPRPAASCLTEVQEGMVVDTISDKVKAIRKGMMELTLINHPLDCPVCDKGGECDLQDLAYMYGREDSRLRDTKMFRPHHRLSSLITLDYNRCILCRRCVRWTEEVADDDLLVYMHRGAQSKVGTFNGTPFVSRFGGMTIELCPVGALLSNVFRFKARAWEVEAIESTCAECAFGCALKGQTRDDGIARLLSREDSEVNGPYFCDRGRFAHDYIDHPDRIVSPLIRKGGRFERISWEQAVETFAEEFKKVEQSDGPRSIGACIDPSETLESLWSFRRLFLDTLGTPRIEHAPAPWALDPDDVPGVLARLATYDEVLRSKDLVLWESDPLDDAPVLGLQLKLAWERGEIGGISITPVLSWLGRKSFPERIVPPHRSRAIVAAIVAGLADKVTSIPAEMSSAIDAARKTSSGVSQDEKTTAETAVRHLLQNDAILIIGPSTLRSHEAEIAGLILAAGLRELISGEPLRLLPMLRCANSLAAMLLGLRTQLLQGADGPQGVGFTGECVAEWPKEIERGKLKAIFLAGDGFAMCASQRDLQSLDQLDFLAVATDFINPLASRANLIIPRPSPFENSGTLITLDGHIRRMRRLVTHPAGVWPLERFFGEVSHVLGSHIPIERSALRAEMASAIPALRMLTSSPMGSLERPASVPFRLGELRHTFDTLEPPAGNRFGVIIVEPVFQHDTRGKHAPHVAAMPEDFACGINREDASRLGFSSGDRVRITGEPGELESRIKLVKIPAGYVLLPYEFVDRPLGEIDAVHNPDARVTLEKYE